MEKMVISNKKEKESFIYSLFSLFLFFLIYIDHDPSPDLVAQLAQEVYRADLLQLLVLNIQKFEFEVDIYIYIYIYNSPELILLCVYRQKKTLHRYSITC